MDYKVRIRYLGSGEPDKETGRLYELENAVNDFLEAGEELINITPCVVAQGSRVTGIRPVNLFAVVTAHGKDGTNNSPGD